MLPMRPFRPTLCVKKHGPLLFAGGGELQGVAPALWKRCFQDVYRPAGRGVDINEFARSITNEKWTEWVDHMETYDVYVEMPKFKKRFEYGDVLTEALKRAGLSDALSSSADYSGAADGLRFSKIRQNSCIEGTEEGTEAAAVTGTGLEMSKCCILYVLCLLAVWYCVRYFEYV